MSRRELLTWVWQHDPRGRAILLLAVTGFVGLTATTVAVLVASDDLPRVVFWNQVAASALSVVALTLITRSVLRRATADAAVTNRPGGHVGHGPNRDLCRCCARTSRVA